MSRSRKKNPIGANCSASRKGMRKAKCHSNGVIRKDDEAIPSGNHYRRIVDRWSFPDDGKRWHTHEKAYRK